MASADWLGYLGRSLVILAGVRAGYLNALWLYGVTGVPRYRVETAWVWFVLAVLVSWTLGGYRGWKTPSAHRPRLPQPVSSRTYIIGAAGCVALALCLYARILGIGLLSDDAVLMDRAEGWQLGWVGDHLLRPIPIGIWALVLSAGGGNVVLHLLNVVIHGVNAYLVFQIARGVTEDSWAAVLAAVLFALSPLATEPVIWVSGLFDLLATSLCCAAVLVARRYREVPARGVRVSLAAILITSFVTKETAVVAPALVLLDAWARGALRSSRTLVADCVLVMAAAAAFASVRLTLPGGGAVVPHLEKYAVQVVLFRSFGGYGSPMHAEFVRSFPLIAVAYSGSLACLLILVGANTHWLRFSAAKVAAQLLWVLASVTPVAAFLYVAADLEGARYLYLGSVGWSILVALLAQRAFVASPRLRPLTSAVVTALVVMSAVATLWQQGLWREAAGVRDRIGDEATRAAAARGCASLTILGLPEKHRGAHLFRNGATEWFALQHHLTVNANTAPPGCTVQWDGVTMRPADVANVR